MTKPNPKKTRLKPRKPLGSVYDAGGGLLGHFDENLVWGRWGGVFGSYAAGVVSHKNNGRIGMVNKKTLTHDLYGTIAFSKNGDFILPGGKNAGRYTGDEMGASAAFLLCFDRKKQRS